MSYKLVKRGEKWCVVNKDTGKSKGCSSSREMGVKHLRVLYAAEGGAEMGKGKKGK